MELSTRFKVVTGTVSVAVALGAAGALAANGEQENEIPLDDVVGLEEVTTTSTTVPSLADISNLVEEEGDSLSSPFDDPESVDTVLAEESNGDDDQAPTVDNTDSPQSPDSADSPDDSSDSPDSPDSADTP